MYLRKWIFSPATTKTTPALDGQYSTELFCNYWPPPGFDHLAYVWLYATMPCALTLTQYWNFSATCPKRAAGPRSRPCRDWTPHASCVWSSSETRYVWYLALLWPGRRCALSLYCSSVACSKVYPWLIVALSGLNQATAIYTYKAGWCMYVSKLGFYNDYNGGIYR